MGGCRTHWIENPSDWVGKAFVRGDGSMREQFVIGIDFGTESGRAVLVDVRSGKEVAHHVTPYRHGVISERLPESDVLLKPDAYLQHPDGAQVMVCQRDGTWETGKIDYPYGRGINLQILVDDIDSLIRSLELAGTPFYQEPHTVWRRYGNREGGRHEFLIQDPDGYLLLFAKTLGERPL